MRHVPAHHWADAERGRLSHKRMARMATHAAGCERCARERDRVLGAMDAFQDIRDTEAPALRWEHIGARIYWVTSSEQRASDNQPSTHGWRRVLVPAVGVLVAAGIVLYWYTGGLSDPSAATERVSTTTEVDDVRDPGPSADPSAATTEPSRDDPGPGVAAVEPEPLIGPLVGLVVLLKGAVERSGTALDMHQPIVSGDRISTTDGEVAVQFGPRESLTIGPDSTLAFERFDERDVSLRVEGQVIVDVGPRRPEQSFVVIAGSRSVHVRGTLFQVVYRDDVVRVACATGRVEVSDLARGRFSVSGGTAIEWPAAADPASPDAPPPVVSEIDDEERAAIQRGVVRVPTWTGDAEALQRTTATLEVAADRGDDPVEIDGEVVSSGSFRLRVLPGRHLIGRRGGSASWHVIESGETAVARVQSKAQASRHEPPRARARRVRREQLLDAIGHGSRLQGCVSALRKQELLDGAFIELEIGLLADGTITLLNIASTNLQPTAARCVRDVVDGVDFPPGPALDFRHRIAW